MIRATVVTVVWDKVPGATGYDILKNDVKVSSTRTATTAKLGVKVGEKAVYTIVARGTGRTETITLRQQA